MLRAGTLAGMSSDLDPAVVLPKRIEHRAVADLLPYARNPRTHSEAQIAEVADSINEFGWTVPILVAGTGEVLAGHARLAAANHLGLDQVPVIVLDHLAKTQMV